MFDNRRESVSPTAPASTYYTTGRNAPRHRTRTYSVKLKKIYQYQEVISNDNLLEKFHRLL
jgi:hypothetical protein